MAQTRFACGASEDEACLLFANREGIEYYKAADYARATESGIGSAAFAMPQRGIYIVTEQRTIDGICESKECVVEARDANEALTLTAADRRWDF